MADSGRLQGLGVLVTRPVQQAESLCQRIEVEAGRPIRLPVLEILDPSDDRGLNDAIDHLEQYDWAIFISVNAVQKAMNRILERRDWPDSLPVAAVGKSSAGELRSYGRPGVLFPASKFNSEGLLELPEMHRVQGKRIVIFRGAGGREFLAASLRERGADVEYVEAYRRARPKDDAGWLRPHWNRGEIDIIVVNSVESLQNLYAMVGELDRKHLLSTPLLVASDRIVPVAQQLGFQHPPLVADNATDEAVLTALVNWRKQQP